MSRAIRSEAELAAILARPGFRIASQVGGEHVNTSTPAAPAPSLAESGSPPVVSAGTLYALVALCRAAGLPEPVPEYRFHPTRKWRFDYAWPLHKLALEVEGGIWTQGRHSRGAGMQQDMQKYSEAAIAGWRLLYVEPRTLATDGLEYVRRALG